MRQATIYIDSEALQYNLNRVKQLAPHSQIVSMVKANAYGHGVQDCLAALNATDAFGVACLEEALEIRRLGYTQPITLIEGVFTEDEMEDVIQQKLECVVHRHEQVEWLIQNNEAYNALGLKVWVKLNSGMNRLGFKSNEIIAVIHQLKSLNFNCVLTMHFANADADHPLNEQQIQQFLDVKNACEPILASCCNSAAIYKYPNLHFDYVRPGIMLYGSTPFADKDVNELDLKPVMSFEAEIIALNQIQAGESVGYGSTFTATNSMQIAIVSIGYGDGYPRAYVKPNYVAIDKQLTPVIGRVSMDMIAIDTTNLQVKVGTKVELWGKTRLVDDVANANGTIGYELLCRLSNRPQRQRI
ncbi:alanine racemase [Acinetobacter junii]|uniref:alanine racemase n=1 Tax=Acinetobacter junii TaxID=40215 RepID=UPI000F7D81C5|nr:alanine racemase [Acinetobacter junii]RTE46557.1 alanine racemase [Acinetobacter junii]VTX58645.1 Alanine racemase, biosynthetic [Acinetobacter junii]